ncbi:hypothetical protein JCM18901_179 [Psychrobacter sp. JCM 18901]|uniref:hypothetical protein n=1 Tax=Psychrobacter sp. JCM 18901 TaxID=1298609 RepID=UPI0004328DB3|nr:hypothetical protein [Psychrobacter sp. JCM 18901]GAF54598.1 hypothetical protein JCM18901_179 [Psychrobacter sp. JCM 18901]
MPNSIRTTSNTQTTTNSTPATFKAGDSVLCPSLSLNPFVLHNDPYGKRKLLAFTHDDSHLYYDKQGYFVPACDKQTGDYQPSLFHDTPANRQAIATLYNGSQSSQRTVIDITEPNDNEVIIMSSHELSDIACDLESAAVVISDIGKLLALIHYEKIKPDVAISMARLTHDTTETWHELLQSQLGSIKKTLAMTRYALLEAASENYPPKQSRKHAKRKSYYKKYIAMRQPKQSHARGNR